MGVKYTRVLKTQTGDQYDFSVNGDKRFLDLETYSYALGSSFIETQEAAFDAYSKSLDNEDRINDLTSYTYDTVSYFTNYNNQVSADTDIRFIDLRNYADNTYAYTSSAYGFAEFVYTYSSGVVNNLIGNFRIIENNVTYTLGKVGVIEQKNEEIINEINETQAYIAREHQKLVSYIDTLAESVVWRDGAYTMTGGLDFANNGLLNVTYIRNLSNDENSYCYIRAGVVIENDTTSENPKYSYLYVKSTAVVNNAEIKNTIGENVTVSTLLKATKVQEGVDTESIGDYTHSEGIGSKAVGECSHAEGYQTNAVLMDAHAEGSRTNANGLASHAEGIETAANGKATHAEGNNTTSIYNGAHAEGVDTIAIGGAAHAEGRGNTSYLTLDIEQITKPAGQYNTITRYVIRDTEEYTTYNSIGVGDLILKSDDFNFDTSNLNTIIDKGITSANKPYIVIDGNIALTGQARVKLLRGVAGAHNAHSEGYRTNSLSKGAHAEGIETCVSPCSAGAHAEGFKTVILNNEPTDLHSGEGGSTGAHTEGYETVIYDYSDGAHAEGYQTSVDGQGGHAEGMNTLVKRAAGHAEGKESKTYGFYAHAEGHGTTAHATASHSEGENTDALGRASHAEGSTTTAQGDYTHAEGDRTKAMNFASHSEGSETEATSRYAHAEGKQSKAIGEASHAEGFNTRANNIYSHTEGESTIANGNDSHAEGSQTVATGACSHTEGMSTAADGNYSHAEGFKTKTTGESAHAEGFETKAIGFASHAEGRNIVKVSGSDTSKPTNDELTCTVDKSSVKTLGAEKKIEVQNVYGINVDFIESTNTLTDGKLYKIYTVTSGGVVSTDPICEMTFSVFDELWIYGGSGLSGALFTVNDTSALTNALSAANVAKFKFVPMSGALADYSHVEGTNSFASSAATSAHVEGNSSVAVGAHSHAEGQYNVASAENAHAEGGANAAYGINSHAEGSCTFATGKNSHAEGRETIAAGLGTHAEGIRTKAYGDYSHVEGNNNYAYNYAEHVEGQYALSRKSTESSIATTHAIGIGTGKELRNRKNALEVRQNGDMYLVGVGAFTGTSDPVNTGSNGAMPVNAILKQCLDSGAANSWATQLGKWGKDTVRGKGFASFAEGYNTEARNWCSHAEGYETLACEECAHAEGAHTEASAEYSHAEGFKSTASAVYAHAEGDETLASATCAHAEGYRTVAEGNYSHAEGFKSTASAPYAHAEGNTTYVLDTGSHAEGYKSMVIGQYSHIEGNHSHIEEITGYSILGPFRITTNDWSPDFKSLTINNCDSRLTYSVVSYLNKFKKVIFFNGTCALSVVEIQLVQNGGSRHDRKPKIFFNNSMLSFRSATSILLVSGAIGNHTHVEGLNTIASGDNSHAEGNATIAKGVNSHSSGLGTIADKDNMTTVGKYNKMNVDGALFVVGNGTGDADANRSNALTVTTSGIQNTVIAENCSLRGSKVPTTFNEGATFKKSVDVDGNCAMESKTNDAAGGLTCRTIFNEKAENKKVELVTYSYSLNLHDESRSSYLGCKTLVTCTSSNSQIEYTGYTRTGSFTSNETHRSSDYIVKTHSNGVTLGGSTYNSSGNVTKQAFIDINLYNNRINIGSDSNIIYIGGHQYTGGGSDIRLKNVVSNDIDLDKAYELIDKCQTIIYTLKDDPTNKEQVGLIAQEVQEFFPEIVYENDEGYLSLDYARITVILMKVMKSIIDRIKALESK